VGIEGELTEEKESAMFAELKRITGEENSDIEFTVDEIVPACIGKAIDNVTQHCEIKQKKEQQH
jgi:hypothetical protein